MKQTKCLFDEAKMTSDGMISVSQLQTFLSCKRKWQYNYIENLKPRVERSYLTIGKLCHRGMQIAMQNAWMDQHNKLCVDFYTLGRWQDWMEKGVKAIEEEFAEYVITEPILIEEIKDLEDVAISAVSVFRQAFKEFEPWKYEVLTLHKGGKPIPALELHFKVPCPPTRGMHGYIDAILKDTNTGFIWCTDYKFRKSLSPDEDESSNIQNAVYIHACKKMGINVTGTMTWQHLNTPAAKPAILKDGKISRTKIKTTWEKYEQFCIEHGQDPQDYYLEMEEKLRDIEWYRATLEYRNDATIDRIWKECVLPVARRIKSARNIKANNFRSLYPWNCKMCQYKTLCQAELRDYDSEYIRKSEYCKRSTEKEDNKPIDRAVDNVL